MNTIVQFIKFGIVGASNTVIGYLIYAISLAVFRKFQLFSDYDIYLANFIMFMLSVAWSFYWNNKYVFKSENRSRKDIFFVLIKTYMTYAFTSLILAEVLLYVWVNILGINAYIAPIINLIITVPLNFLIQKFWAFKDSN